MTTPNYTHWDDSRVEPPVDSEAAKISNLQSTFHSIQRRNFSAHRHAMRSTHVKTQAIVKGKLLIPAGLAPHLRQGLFAHNGAYDVALRFANEPSLLQDDKAPGPRGLGMRVFGLPAGLPHLDDVGTRTRTQDFTFNNAPVLELRDVETANEIVGLREKYAWTEPETLEKELGKRDDKELQFAPAQLPNHHFLAYTMYSQSAYRFGEYVCKYALFPTGDTQKALEKSHAVGEGSGAEQHSEWLREWFGENNAEYDFRVQLLVDPEGQSVEDTSVEWDEGKYPFETVGKVVVPGGQDSFGAARRTFWEDRMKLNVWYGLEEHRPLGSVNRLRKEVYKASQKFRAEVNSTELVDVDSVDQIP